MLCDQKKVLGPSEPNDLYLDSIAVSLSTNSISIRRQDPNIYSDTETRALSIGVSPLWFYVLSVISIHVSWSVFAVLFIVFAALPSNAYSNLGKYEKRRLTQNLLSCIWSIQLNVKEY